MSARLTAQVKKSKNGKIQIEISRDDFERFCNAFGIYRSDFLETLRASENDHRAGRITKRDSLFELMGK